MASPLVSIIMPAYNAAKYLNLAVDSILAQTYPHWELIIVDDASTDNTPEVLAGLTDPRIRTLRVDKIGTPAGVRNVALKMISGAYIAFLDADDLYFPDTLARLLDKLENNPDWTAVYGFSQGMDAEGQPDAAHDVLIATADGQGFMLPPYYKHTWELILCNYLSCLLPSLMLRREAFERVGFFNDELLGGEDYEFFIRLFLDKFDGVQFIPEFIYRYRIYPGSLTKDPIFHERLLKSSLKIMDWLYQQNVLPKADLIRSKSYSQCYRYFAREKLIHNQCATARHIALSGFRDPNVALKDWMGDCMPLLVRSCMPHALDQALVEARRHLRQLKYRLPPFA